MYITECIDGVDTTYAKVTKVVKRRQYGLKHRSQLLSNFECRFDVHVLRKICVRTMRELF